jgi:CubicO group peptidase (beta-lactamase class C family)
MTPRPQVDAVLREAVESGEVPGVVAMAATDRGVLYEGAFGRRALGQPEPMTLDSVFRIASMTKAITSVAAMQLVEQGKLALEAPVPDIDPTLGSPQVLEGFDAAGKPRLRPARRPITLRHLLTHTAGFSYCWYPGYPRDAAVPTLAQVLRGEPPANTPPVVVTAVPGSAYRYAGGHFSVLQQLLEDVTGKPFPALMSELVLDPLGMDCTSYDQMFPEAHGDVAAAHHVGGDPLAGGWRVLPEMAGAGLWTTPSDLARIALDVRAAWAGGDAVLLDRATAQAALTPGLGNWGLGWEVADWDHRRHFQHGGSNIGYKCRLICDAERGNGVAVMTNGDDGEQVYTPLIQAISREYGWTLPGHSDDVFRLPPSSWSAPTPNPELLSACAGQYITESGELITISADLAGLEAGFEGQPPVPLQPTGGLTFRSTMVNVQVAFVRNERGLIEDCLLHQNEDVIPASRIG